MMKITYFEKEREPQKMLYVKRSNIKLNKWQHTIRNHKIFGRAKRLPICAKSKELDLGYTNA